jgi:hypothetical protein
MIGRKSEMRASNGAMARRVDAYAAAPLPDGVLRIVASGKIGRLELPAKTIATGETKTTPTGRMTRL